MKIRLLAVLSAISILTVSCREAKKKIENPLEKAAWLIGTWENDSRAGKLSETWVRSNDGNFNGTGTFVAGTDTVFSEKLKLVRDGDDLYYVATVKDQNNGEPVTFALSSATGNELAFENKAHDFPQKIVYTHRGDSLIAVVSGVRDGQLKTEDFRMRRASR